jgi:hypothetical protein
MRRRRRPWSSKQRDAERGGEGHRGRAKKDAAGERKCWSLVAGAGRRRRHVRTVRRRQRCPSMGRPVPPVPMSFLATPGMILPYQEILPIYCLGHKVIWSLGHRYNQADPVCKQNNPSHNTAAVHLAVKKFNPSIYSSPSQSAALRQVVLLPHLPTTPPMPDHVECSEQCGK